MKTGSQVEGTAEARRAARKPMRTLAEIIGEGSQHGISCLVLDMSGTGAKLKIETAARKPFTAAVGVPETFRLFIPRDNASIECRLAWREKDMIGVTFTTAFRPAKTGTRR